MAEGLKDKIQASLTTIVNQLTQCNQILDYLLQNKCIGMEEYESVLQVENSSQQNRKLVTTILKKNTSRVYSCFMEALKKNEENDIYQAIMEKKLGEAKTQQRQLGSVDEVCRWLAKLNLDSSIIEDFQKNEIDGEAFEYLTLEEIHKCISPSAAVGPLKKVLNRRHEFYESLPQEEEAGLSMANPQDQKVKQFENEEQSQKQPSWCESDHTEKLKLLLTQGNPKLGNISLILAVNALPTSFGKEMIDNFHFLVDLNWLYVIDFDSKDTLYNYLEHDQQQLLQVTNLSSFSPDKAETHAPFDDLEDSFTEHSKTWLFANGRSSLKKDPENVREWKLGRGKHFREFVQKIQKVNSVQRIVVVFLLLSGDLDVMLEAADALITEFPNNWFAVAQEQEFMERWIEGLREKHLDSVDLKPISVNLEWQIVNRVIGDLVSTLQLGPIQIPSSEGMVSVPNKVINELCDLDILCSSAYNEAQLEGERMEQKILEAEQAFYRGGQASWWNFYLGHVIDRNVVHELVDDARSAMKEPNENNRIDTIQLYHQPGAGASTVARHVLWKMKDECRCIVIRQITDETLDQLLKLHRYNDNKPEPVLVLLDNEEEDGVDKLRADLEERTADTMEWEFDSERRVFFVFLSLERCSEIEPLAMKHYLKQELAPNEIKMFNEKFSELTRKFKETEDHQHDPKHLISFNIMKENFSEEYIRETVTTIVRSLADEKELRFCMYVALLNAYDIRFQPLPVSAFDNLMQDYRCKFGVCGTKRWEDNLSLSADTLLIQENDEWVSSGSQIRIIHGKVTDLILDQLMQMQEKKRVTDVFTDFLQSCLPLDVHCTAPVKRLITIVCNLVKKRRYYQKADKPDMFSPIIQHIFNENKQGHEDVARILDHVHKLSDDVFIGQQLARVYMKYEEWKKSQEVSHDLVHRRRNNSYLWDTYGLSYLKQLKQRVASVEKCKSISAKDMKTLIPIFQQAMTQFQKAQEVCETEKNPNKNTAGYQHELETIELLIRCLYHVDELKESSIHLSDILCGIQPMPRSIAVTLSKHFQEDIGKFQDRSNDVISRLEDCIARDQNPIDEQKLIDSITLRKKIGNFFGMRMEDGFLQPDQLCRIKRGRIDKRIAKTYSVIVRFAKMEGKKPLIEAHKLLSDIIKSEASTPFDKKRYLSVSLALCYVDKDFKAKIDQVELAQIAKWIYDNREKIPQKNLEPFFFAAALNWPLSEGSAKAVMTTADLKELLSQWKKILKPTPWLKRQQLLFIGTQSGMERLVFPDELQSPKDRPLCESPECIEILEWFHGLLEYDGKSVEVMLPEDKFINIDTYQQVRTKRYFNKKVYFAIVFTWAGPKAIGISLENPQH